MEIILPESDSEQDSYIFCDLQMNGRIRVLSSVPSGVWNFYCRRNWIAELSPVMKSEGARERLHPSALLKSSLRFWFGISIREKSDR